MGNALATSETACFKRRGSPARAPRSIQLPVLKMDARLRFRGLGNHHGKAFA